MGKQLALALNSPAEHGDLIHSGRRHGTVLLWLQKCAKRWIKIAPEDNLSNAFQAQLGQTDRYFSINEFYKWRSVDLLRSLRACYVDLDGYTDWPTVLDALDDFGLPKPSLVVESGRGLHLYWPIEPVPSKALPVWQAIQDTLIEKLKPFGADSKARDCTRVLRVIGSVNSRNNKQTRGWVISPKKWQFRQLADDVLGVRKPKLNNNITNLEGQRVKRQASLHQRTGPYRLWYSRYRDLCEIANYHTFMRPYGITEGHRDTTLFLLANALSWFTSADTLQESIHRVAKTFTPSLSSKEVCDYTKPIVTRALAAQKGEKQEWNGQMKDPRYAFRTETIRSWIAPLLVPELESKLTVLGKPMSQEEKSEIRKIQWAVRDKTRSRVQEGRYKQSKAERQAEAKERAKEATTLRNQGLSIRSIAKQLGVSVGSVSGWCSKSAPLCIASPLG